MIPSYVRWKLGISTAIIALSIGFVTLKGPTLVKGMAKASLEQGLAPLGIAHVEIDAIRFGWGRIYLQDIHTSGPVSAPNLTIQEMDIALSLFLGMKAVDVVGATLELKDTNAPGLPKEEWRAKINDLGKAIHRLKPLKIPTISMHDCLLIIPAVQKNPLKIPLHVVTETTVARHQVLTIEWGEHGEETFYGQFILELGKKGMKVDLHAAHVDIKIPSLELKASEISFWGTTESEENEGCKAEGFAKLDHLALAPYGQLKMPLEVNVEASGTEDNLDLDTLTISSPRSETSILEIEGTFKPGQRSAQIVLTSQIPQLSALWDFTPFLATHAGDKVSVGGQVNVAAEILWEGGDIKTSALALDLKNGTLARGGFSIEGVTSQVIFSTLNPLTTKGTQRLSATKLALAGINLRNVVLECLFDPDGLLQINQFTAELLSGKVKAHHFQRLDKHRPSYQFEAHFKRIELADILKLTDLKSLSGRARLAGSASMRYGLEEGLEVLQAELHSISDSGLIQYKPDSSIEKGISLDQEVNMAFQVLSDLSFTVFNVRLERAPNNPSEMQGIVKILGSNPKVLNGYPFEFNIVTTGKLKDFVMNTIHHMNPYTDLSELTNAARASKESREAAEKAGN